MYIKFRIKFICNHSLKKTELEKVQFKKFLTQIGFQRTEKFCNVNTLIKDSPFFLLVKDFPIETSLCFFIQKTIIIFVLYLFFSRQRAPSTRFLYVRLLEETEFFTRMAMVMRYCFV